LVPVSRKPAEGKELIRAVASICTADSLKSRALVGDRQFFLYMSDAVPATDVTLPVSADGTVHAHFTVFNTSEIAAVDGELTLQICDQCKFAK
jgi:hypothetical protein